jgi:hypothetical protein
MKHYETTVSLIWTCNETPTITRTISARTADGAAKKAVHGLIRPKMRPDITLRPKGGDDGHYYVLDQGEPCGQVWITEIAA